MMEFENLRSSDLTSLQLYLDKKKSWVNTDLIINLIGSVSKYEKFVKDQVDYQRKLSKIKNQLLD